ncbi:MAG: TonB-dependent receptor [Proteobacteria bacterium]|nr:TonB-dependent receptor [Pseudomonadota bacterium]
MSTDTSQRAAIRRGLRSSVRAVLWSAAVAPLAAMPAFAAETTETTKLEEIVVTGSLIRSPNQVSASPIVSTGMDTLEKGGDVSLIANLNQMPQFNATSGVFSGGQGTGGRVTINLRGLGSNRNLVLLDGRRLPLSDINGNVDTNAIPEMAVSSIDVITGGASAVYGSDAMSGVVNFMTVPYFDGIEADVQFGDSSRGDVQKVAASFALGSSFADDKGHVLVSVGYTDREGMYGSERKFFEFVTPSGFIGQGTFVPSSGNFPNQDAVNALFASYGAVTPVANNLNLGFNDDGTLFTQTGAKNYKGPTTDGYAVLGGNVRMPVGPQFLLVTPTDRTSLFSKFDYEVSEALTLYGQLMYVDSTVYTESGGSLTQFGTLTTIPVTNPFIPDDLSGLLATRPNPTAPFTWNGRYVGIHYKGWDEQYTTAQYLLGAKGDLPFKDWTYDLYGSIDSTDHNQTMFHAVLKSRVQQLLNAPDGGDSICDGGFNPFGIVNSTVISQECVDYMTTTATSTEWLEQSIVQGTVQGSLFELPAGNVRAALLAGWRENTYEYNPDHALASQDIEAVLASQAAKGDIDVTEFALQIEVPLLADAQMARSLTLGAGYRYSDYSTAGGVNAYEGDIKWRPVDSILLRTSYQRAVRAPSIGELYAAEVGSQVPFGTPPTSIGDPCDVRSTARTGAGGDEVRDLCLEQGIPLDIIDTYTFPTTATAGVLSGNPELEPETADTFNVGVQWTSTSASELWGNQSLSVDYYNIEINDVISVVPGLTTLSKCYNLDGTNPTYSNDSVFCQLLHRDANGLLQLIETPYLNLGALSTDGVDVDYSWRPSLSAFGADAPGNLFFHTYVSYVNSFEIQTISGEPSQDFVHTIAVGASHPQWKAMTDIGWETETFSVGLRWRYLESMDDITSVTTPATPAPGTPTYNTYDLFGTYSPTERLEFRAGITNFTDELSVKVSTSQWSTDPSVYDPIGRQYYLGMRFSL